MQRTLSRQRNATSRTQLAFSQKEIKVSLFRVAAVDSVKKGRKERTEERTKEPSKEARYPHTAAAAWEPNENFAASGSDRGDRRKVGREDGRTARRTTIVSSEHAFARKNS